MASIAVFVALGGVGYAATTINGNKIIKGTVGGGKLKKGTVTGTQVKQNSLTGSSIDESSLGTVPSAQSAQTASSATTAITATSATTAGSASTAGSANTAKSADSAAHALSADTATSATTAVSADTAATAEEADTLDGLTSKQLQVTCPVETELYGGMCWDEDARLAANWIKATSVCGDAGGRLPSISELVAYVLQPEEQVSGPNWTGDVYGINVGSKEIPLARDETTTGPQNGENSLGYRCLFYRVN
ncbi:MAG TPA: hypothetical protein VGO13_11480 [Solirubrobacterales bacterium]|nr:hypothetical protein [Solirubrobacterales bacterium]